MSLRFVVLASGSAGNSFLVSSDTTAILIDAGLRAKEISERLRGMGEDMSRVKGVLVTHGHSDHSCGLSSLVSGYRLPIYASSGTRDELLGMSTLKLAQRHPDWHVIGSSDVVAIGDLKVTTFPVVHDAAEPVGFYIQNGSGSVAIATDLATVDGEPEEWLSRSSCFFLESNYDFDALMACDYAPIQRRRVVANHMANNNVKAAISRFAKPHHQILLGHISSNSNSAELVRSLYAKDARVTVVPPWQTSPVITVSKGQ